MGAAGRFLAAAALVACLVAPSPAAAAQTRGATIEVGILLPR